MRSLQYCKMSIEDNGNIEKIMYMNNHYNDKGTI